MNQFRIDRIQELSDAIMGVVLQLDISENTDGSREHMVDAAIAMLSASGAIIAAIASTTDKSDPRRKETVEMIKQYMSEVLSV